VSLVRRLKLHFGNTNEKDRRIVRYLKSIIGYTPRNYNLFKLATIHSSAAKANHQGIKESNERLEYLGDAILGSVVAEHLFKKFPFKDEGFLTEIRSRIVNRESLNGLGRKLGLENIIEVNRKVSSPHKSIYGDTLEAIIGAVYLDRGYSYCQKFILQKLLEPYYDLSEIVKANPNAKSTIIEWAQKEGKEVEFEIMDIQSHLNRKEFTVRVLIDGEPLSTGYGNTKKKAEQDAAQRSCNALNLG
jgi:ribonuclease-3